MLEACKIQKVSITSSPCLRSSIAKSWKRAALSCVSFWIWVWDVASFAQVPFPPQTGSKILGSKEMWDYGGSHHLHFVSLEAALLVKANIPFRTVKNHFIAFQAFCSLDQTLNHPAHHYLSSLKSSNLPQCSSWWWLADSRTWIWSLVK